MSKAEILEEPAVESGSSEFPTPYLGRTVRIVGPHVNVDMNESPHPKNARGELGKPLFNLYRNTVAKDCAPGFSAEHFADRRPVLKKSSIAIRERSVAGGAVEDTAA